MAVVPLTIRKAIIDRLRMTTGSTPRTTQTKVTVTAIIKPKILPQGIGGCDLRFMVCSLYYAADTTESAAVVDGA